LGKILKHNKTGYVNQMKSVEIKRVLIFRPDNIGDVILFSGAFRHIRALHPRAHITLAVQSHIVNLVALCPYVDNVVSIDDLILWRKLQKKGVRGSYHFARVLRIMERSWKKLFQPFDSVIYPIRSPQVPHLKILSDLCVKVILGIVGCNVNEPEDGYPDHIHPKKLYSGYLDVSSEDPWRHEIFTTLDFLRFLGREIRNIDDIKPELWVSKPEQNVLKDIVDSNGTTIGLFPGASDCIRCWNVENYAKLTDSINYEVDAYVLFGGPNDANLASEIERLLEKAQPGLKIVNLAGKTTLQELYKCISECSVLISMESAGLHMGITAGVPTVGIAGGGHYGRFIPWGDKTKNIVLTEKLDCFNCNWRCDRERIECIEGVTPAEVASAVNRLLRNQKNETRRNGCQRLCLC
jgi:ADP-heptose:LPS heptosyltransferase